MKRNTLELRIFLFCEIVVALRILLFEIPVFLDKFFKQKTTDLSETDRFMAIVVFMSVFYLAAGLASLFGHKFWQLLHYLVTALTGFLTLSFYYSVQNAGNTFEPLYYVPLVCSALVSLVVFAYRECSSVFAGKHGLESERQGEKKN